MKISKKLILDVTLANRIVYNRYGAMGADLSPGDVDVQILFDKVNELVERMKDAGA